MNNTWIYYWMMNIYYLVGLFWNRILVLFSWNHGLILLILLLSFFFVIKNTLLINILLNMEIGNIDWRYIVDSFYYWMNIILDLLLIWLLD